MNQNEEEFDSYTFNLNELDDCQHDKWKEDFNERILTCRYCGLCLNFDYTNVNEDKRVITIGSIRVHYELEGNDEEEVI